MKAHEARQVDGLRSLTARAPWVAVTGAKGGVGKTLVAVNLALLLARSGYRTLLVDLDPGCGNIDVHLRLQRKCTLDDAVSGLCEVDDAIVDGPFGLQVLGGRSGSTSLCDANSATIERTFAAVARAAEGCDVVVCDTGAGLGAMSIATAERADLVLAIATPDPSAMTDAYAQCKLLHLRGRPLPRLLINGAASRDDAMTTAGRFASVCRKFLGQDGAMFGWLRRDPVLERSTKEQRPLALHGHGTALDELRALCAATLSALPMLPRRVAREATAVRLAEQAANDA